MSKYVFPDGPPDVLNIQMAYEQFLDLMTDAWIQAGELEDEPTPDFRKALFYLMDKNLAAPKDIK